MDSVKYLQLLKPLRVLADNWDIDLAQELTEYVDEMDKMTQTLQQQNSDADGGNGVNFAQAALLIQNSANIYSKKVQYLYSMTQEAHDYIFNRGTSSGDRKKQDGGDDDDNDDNSDDGQAQDGEGNNNGKLKGRQRNANGIFDSFDCLDSALQKKDFNANEEPICMDSFKCENVLVFYGSSSSNLKSIGGAGSGNFEILTADGESIGSKSDFEINQAFIAANGMFFSKAVLSQIDHSDEYSARRSSFAFNVADLTIPDIDVAQIDDRNVNNNGNNNQPYDFGFSGEPQSSSQLAHMHEFNGGQSLSKAGDSVPDLQNDNSNSEMQNDDSDGDDDEGIENIVHPHYSTVEDISNPRKSSLDIRNLQKLKTPPKKLVTRKVTVEATPPKRAKRLQNHFTFWQFMDPHEEDQTSKPFKKGAVNRQFKIVEKVISANMEHKPKLKPLPVFIKEVQQAKVKSRIPKDLFHNIDPQFEYLYVKEKERRDKIMKPKPEKLYKEIEVTEEQDASVLEMPSFENYLDQGSMGGDDDSMTNLNENHGPPANDVEDDDEFDTDADILSADLHNSLNGESNRQSTYSQGTDMDIEPSNSSAGFIVDQVVVEKPIQSFEDLCRLKIKNYMQLANDYERRIESNLSKNVKSWENRLQPLLHEQHIRGVFDVDIVRESVLETFQDKVQEEKRLDFSQLVQRLPGWNVSRWFISTLHLANEERIVVTKDEDCKMVLLKPEGNVNALAHSRLISQSSAKLANESQEDSPQLKSKSKRKR
ncbi:hypothetical protein MIR68_005790 [Amoeboaphelidium protococcarum]|nr:hypothetical protein MIR68_005790 [Amoeboaphelidium protococcarum]